MNPKPLEKNLVPNKTCIYIFDEHAPKITYIMHGVPHRSRESFTIFQTKLAPNTHNKLRITLPHNQHNYPTTWLSIWLTSVALTTQFHLTTTEHNVYLAHRTLYRAEICFRDWILTSHAILTTVPIHSHK